MQLPVIDGKEIVPVRLIPVVTHNRLGPESLSGILANRLRVDGFKLDPTYNCVDDVTDEGLPVVTKVKLSDRCARDIDVYAYHLDHGGTPVKMLSIEWDNIYFDITKLEPVLRMKEKEIGVHNALYSVWREQATQALPPGVFLWRHDLYALWQFHLSFYSEWSGERPDQRILNLEAYVRPEYLSMYLEGFEQLLNKNDRQLPISKSSNLPPRTGMTIPEDKRRKEEDFTRSIRSFFKQSLESGNKEKLEQGNLVDFLRALKKRVEGLDKLEDGITTYGELVEWVKPSETDCVMMVKPRVVRNKKEREKKPYTRNDVSKLLSELRNAHREHFPVNRKKCFPQTEK